MVDELARVEGKAEIIDGRIVHLPMTGIEPGYAGDEIFASLHLHAKHLAVGDSKGFLVDLPRRRSFSPDAAFHTEAAVGMKFFPKAPVFAVEVRSEGDDGPAAECDLAAKRADYLAAGTRVVWDVDLLSKEVVRVYRADDAGRPAAVYRRGEQAAAEGAVPGWTLPVDDLFQV